MHKWYEEKGNNSDIVLSTRVGLARNISKYPFPSRISDNDTIKLVEEIRNEINSACGDKKFLYCDLPNLSEVDKTAMVERHIISPLIAVKKQQTGLMVSEDEADSIMINEEDHIKIQSFTSGMNIEKVYKSANYIDDMICQKLHYAYDKRYGYLTANPSNTGTGLKVSYMVLLPALTAAGKIQRLADEVGRYGVAMRGIYEEGSKSIAGIYQITNRKTLGVSENDIVENLNNIVIQVIKQEKKRREYILMSQFDQLEDQVYRSYGVLKYAKQINSVDAVTLITQLKFGIDCKIIKLKSDINFYEMIINTQPANLQYNIGKAVGSNQRDKVRAEYISKNLPDILDK